MRLFSPTLCLFMLAVSACTKNAAVSSNVELPEQIDQSRYLIAEVLDENSADKFLYVFTADGKTLWSKNLRAVNSQVTSKNGKIYILSENELKTYDLTTGEYMTSMPWSAYNSFPFHVGNQMYTVQMGGYLSTVDPQHGVITEIEPLPNALPGQAFIKDSLIYYYIDIPFGFPTLHAYDRVADTIVWRAPPSSGLINEYEEVSGKFIFNAGFYLFAIDAVSGKQLWRKNNFYYQQDVGVNNIVRNDVMYAIPSYTPTSLAAIDLNTGATLWEFSDVTESSWLIKIHDIFVYGDQVGLIGDRNDNNRVYYKLKTSDGTVVSRREEPTTTIGLTYGQHDKDVFIFQGQPNEPEQMRLYIYDAKSLTRKDSSQIISGIPVRLSVIKESDL